MEGEMAAEVVGEMAAEVVGEMEEGDIWEVDGDSHSIPYIFYVESGVCHIRHTSAFKLLHEQQSERHADLEVEAAGQLHCQTQVVIILRDKCVGYVEDIEQDPSGGSGSISYNITSMYSSSYKSMLY